MVIYMTTYYNKQVAWVMPVLMIAAALSVLICLVLLAGSTASAGGTSRTDGMKDIGGHWAAAEIERALGAGYIRGFPDGSFRPDDPVSRAEFVTMLDGAFQVAAGQYKNIPKDVSRKDWFAKDVESALAAGFVSAYPDGTFRPREGVDRQDAARMLGKLLKLDGKGGLSFSDAGQIATGARPVVSGLVAAGIMSGYPDGSFRPKRIVTRAEAVVMINRALAFRSVTPVTDQLQVTRDIVNVRSGPGTGAPQIGQVHSGDVLQARAKNSENWYQIDYQGGSGWIAGWCVQVCQPASSASQPAPSGTTGATDRSTSSGTAGASDRSTSSGTTGAADRSTSPEADGSTSSPSPGGAAGATAASRGGLGALDVQVRQDSSGTTVDIAGAPGAACQWTEETDPQRLVVTVPGITVVRSPLEIDVGTGGLDKIITSLSDTALETATVVISFMASSAPLAYHTARGDSGDLLITVPPQIYQVQAGLVSDFVAINLWGTAPLKFQTSQVSDPSPGLAFDFTGFSLGPSLQSWQQQLHALGIVSLLLSQYEPDVVRLVAAGTRDVVATSDSGAGGRQLVVRLKAADITPTPANNASPDNGSFFYGIDLSPYPGDDAMQAWWDDSPFYYTGFYLGPAPYHPDVSFMDKRQVLLDQGWGLMPIYVGRQADSWYLNAPTGTADADDAVNLAASAGFPQGTTIFLDIETAWPLTDSYLDYVTAWVKEIQGKGYGAGIYCNADNAGQIRDALPGAVEFWAAHYTGHGLPSSTPSPAGSGVSFADAWQFSGDNLLTYGGYRLSVDLDTSVYTDPANRSTKPNK
jgi:uncharacterized protein YraI